MGNQLGGGMCCDGDNSREIKQVRQVAPAPKTAFETHSLQQHSQSRTDGKLLRPFASSLANDSGAAARESSLRQDAAADPRPLPMCEEHHTTVYADADNDTHANGGLRSGPLVSPRPLSALSAASDSSSPAGSAGFMAPAFKPPPIGLRARAAFSHSPDSPFTPSPRGRTGSSANPVGTDENVSSSRGRTQSAYAAGGYENIQNRVGVQQGSSTRGKQGAPVVQRDYYNPLAQSERTGNTGRT
jgi:hypothetical protein